MYTYALPERNNFLLPSLLLFYVYAAKRVHRKRMCVRNFRQCDDTIIISRISRTPLRAARVCETKDFLFFATE